jgi:DNA-directed RNA polymerase sigma subunit (sigma70/sigma32)
VLVSRAVTYPFLDPFAAEFSYAGGHITFDHPLPDDFSKALSDCLSDTVSKLAFQLKRADLENKVRTRLGGLSEKHAAVIDRFGLRDDIQEFVA